MLVCLEDVIFLPFAICFGFRLSMQQKIGSNIVQYTKKRKSQRRIALHQTLISPQRSLFEW